MPEAIILNETGGPDVLALTDIATEPPKSNEIQIRNDVIGVNFIDTYFREGLYGTELPAIIGDQAVATVTAVGAEVKGFAEGEKIAYASLFGAYRAERCVDPTQVVKLPGDISGEGVAASLTRGLTAEYLLCRLHPLKSGETIIVQAAAGGTGVIVCQWAKALGANVIGTVGDDAKIPIAEANGCDHVLRHQDPDFIAKVIELTHGKLADVVYDSIGKDTFETSIQCVRPRGLMVAYGNASGKPEPIEVLDLARLGSIFLTRPILSHYISTRADFEMATGRYFDVLRNRTVQLPEITPFKLADASEAHRHLQDRSKSTLPILVP